MPPEVFFTDVCRTQPLLLMPPSEKLELGGETPVCLPLKDEVKGCKTQEPERALLHPGTREGRPVSLPCSLTSSTRFPHLRAQGHQRVQRSSRILLQDLLLCPP